MDNSIDALACEHNFITDKTVHGHNYNKTYCRYFDQLRNNPVKLLEIGVSAGHSVQVWTKYFANGTVVGFDQDIRINQYGATDRLTLIQGDQQDAELLTKISNEHGPFDIIIDDGSHIDAITKKSFDTLFPLLAPGGLYIVEDLHTSYQPIVHGIPNSCVFIDHVKELIDCVNSHGCCSSGDMLRCTHNNPESQYCSHNKMQNMDKLIEFVHAYKNLVFIKKY
jgi:demethylmacrocin O-methyltransferase